MTTETENKVGLTIEQQQEKQRNYRIDQAQAELKVAQAALDAARQRLEQATKPTYPEEPGAGEVVRFSLEHEAWGNTYAYAAIRVGYRWYTTGSSCPKSGYTWHELIDFIRGADRISTKPFQLLGHTRRDIEL